MYIFSWGGGRVENVLGTPPRGFQKGGGGNSKKKSNQGPPTPFSTFFLAQNPPPQKDRAKIRPPYAGTFFLKNVLEGVPPPSVHFLAGG